MPKVYGLIRFLKVTISIAVIGGVALCILSRPIALVRYDNKTTELGKLLGHFTNEQWANIYRESEQIFRKHSDLDSRQFLGDAQLPAGIRGLGFDRCYVDNEGVFYLRIGSGWSDSNATQVHCIFAPDMMAHDRKGVWFDGFRTVEWVFEPESHPRTEQDAGDQTRARSASELGRQ